MEAVEEAAISDRVARERPSKEVIFEVRPKGINVPEIHTNLEFWRRYLYKKCMYNSGRRADVK